MDKEMSDLAVVLRNRVARRPAQDRAGAAPGTRGLMVGKTNTALKEAGLPVDMIDPARHALLSLLYSIPGGSSKSVLLTHGMALELAGYIDDDAAHGPKVASLARAALHVAADGEDPCNVFGPILYNDPIPTGHEADEPAATALRQSSLEELEYVPVSDDVGPVTPHTYTPKPADPFASFYDDATPLTRQALKQAIADRTAALPEVAASANVTMMGPGGVTQITIRDTNELDLMERVVAVQNRLRKLGWVPCNRWGDPLKPHQNGSNHTGNERNGYGN